jgi:hypothetical protein
MSNQKPEVTQTSWPDKTRTKPHVRNIAPDESILLKKEIPNREPEFFLLEIYPDNPEQYPERYKLTTLNSCNRSDLSRQWTPPGSPPGPHIIGYYEDDPRRWQHIEVCGQGGRNKKRKTARKRDRKRNRRNKTKRRHKSIRRKKTLR